MTTSKHIFAGLLLLIASSAGVPAQAADTPTADDYYGSWRYPAGTVSTISCAGFPPGTHAQEAGEFRVRPGPQNGEFLIESPEETSCPVLATQNGDTLLSSGSTHCPVNGRQAQVEVTSLSLQSADGVTGTLAIQMSMQATVEGQTLDCMIEIDAQVTRTPSNK